MFIKKNPSTPKTNSSTAGVTFIAADCRITGNIVVQGDLRIDGKVDGKIESSGEVVIGDGAIIHANIKGKTIFIAGEVRGDIEALELLDLTAVARLYGNISSKLLKIDQGAVFIGQSKLIEQKVPNQDKEVYTLKKANKAKKLL